MSLLHKQALKQRLGGGLPPMPPSGVGGAKKKGKAFGKQRDYSPVYWDNYFEHKHDVPVGENTFRVYECGSEGPVLLFLHGGGYSALSWAVLCGAVSHLVKCRCAAIDLRGHGDSVSTDDKTLSAEVLSSDVGAVVRELYGEEPPSIILVGHSMGGAIAVHVAVQSLIPSLAGLIVIDVVEGTALEALTSMQGFLKGRPKVFRSLEHAIEWCVRSGQVRNLESARVSMVGQVKRLDTNETASHELEYNHDHPDDNTDNQSGPQPKLLYAPENSNMIKEEDEEDEEGESEDHNLQPANQEQSQSSATPNESQQSSNTSSEQSHGQGQSPTSFKAPEAPGHQYTWRIDLSETERYWRGWFEGLSNKFLSCDVPKMLLLAGVDRLDKDLTIGQMQGKFQMQVLPRCGHAVHEDVPEQVAEALATFLTRYKMASATANFTSVFPGC
ncbi:protein phosphatase methylesterase 1-like [Mya arenaria]|uniref:protein phosphatase methylesterase 1-like n=1 Tax=Mya arenaria TaxID=6604 RepID=UPI0022E19172|nr:protein phosphatase methylesterase 1-like [Mya arenaria]